MALGSSLRFIGSYYDQLYIQALKNSIEEFWTKNDKPKLLLAIMAFQKIFR